MTSRISRIPQIAGDVLEGGSPLGDPWQGVDREELARAVREQAARPVAGVDDMASYLAAQVADVSHREVVGPLLDGCGASGAVVRRGVVIASWGDPARAEMAYSATKSVLSLVAGIAFDDGLLRLDEPVADSVGSAAVRRLPWARDHLAAPARPDQPVGGRTVGQADACRRAEHP